MELKLAYEEMYGRNAGFLNVGEQRAVRSFPVFICGVGGMGGACLYSLVRTGFERIGIADIDTFETSNLNRQIFANLDSIGQDKAVSTARQIEKLNPAAQIRNWGHDWVGHLDRIMSEYKVIVNGTDDIRAGIALYRKAREHGCTVVDAYTSPLPSVYVTRPEDPRPEERLGFPSVGRDVSSLTDRDIDECKLAEIVFVLAHSNSIDHVDFDAAVEMVNGERPRMSLAPMVLTTGNLMSYQVLLRALERETTVSCEGFFLNPATGRTEKPGFIAVRVLKEFLVRKFLRKALKHESATAGR